MKGKVKDFIKCSSGFCIWVIEFSALLVALLFVIGWVSDIDSVKSSIKNQDKFLNCKGSDICVVDNEYHYITLLKLNDGTLISIDNANVYAYMQSDFSKYYEEITGDKIKINGEWYTYRKE